MGVMAGVSDEASRGEIDERALWIEHADDLVGFATVLVGAGDAHDVVSVAFHRVVARLRSGAQVDNHRAYLMRSVTNVANDQRRSQKRRQRRDLRATPRMDAASGSDLIAGRIDLRQAVAGLSVQQRAVVYFTYWEDLESSEVGRLLDIAPATVRRHLVRARTQLRKELA